MKLKKAAALLLSLVTVFSAVPLQAAQLNNSVQKEEPIVKYENPLYHIGYDIPQDSYFIMQKDKTKPAFVAIYSNYGNPKSELHKYYELSKYTEIDYLYPHLFDNNEVYNQKTKNAVENQGKCIYSKYFEFNDYIDLTEGTVLSSSYPYNFLCMENCYAVSAKYADKMEWNGNNDGYMSSTKLFKKNDSYIIKASVDKPKGYFYCCKYDKNTGKTKILDMVVDGNSAYSDISRTDIENYYSSRPGTVISIPKEANIICKRNVEIYDVDGKPLYIDQELAVADKFTEKYSFNDITPAYKNYAQEQIKHCFDGKYDDFFKAVTQSAKTDADKEYARYIREIGEISRQSSFRKIYVNKNLPDAKSFKDLDYILRNIVYLEDLGKRNIETQLEKEVKSKIKEMNNIRGLS